VKVLAAQVDGFAFSIFALWSIATYRMEDRVVVLSAIEDGNVAIVSALRRTLVKSHVPANGRLQSLNPSRKGGRTPDMAEAGGDASVCPPSRACLHTSRACCSERSIRGLAALGPTVLACGIELKRSGISAVLID